MTNMKIFNDLTPKNERMPKKTGIGGTIEPMKMVPFVQPEFFIQNNPAIKANIAPFNPVNPKNIRADFLMKLNASIEGINSMLSASKQFKNISIGVHEESGFYFAVVRDQSSGRVLKQYPGENFLEIASRLQDASGLLVDIVG